MTRSQVITALVLVMLICLGLSALLIPLQPDPTTNSTRLVPFPPSEVAAIEVRLTDGSTQRLTRQAPDSWQVQLPSDINWPASTSRVRAFLRILDRITGFPATEAPPPASTTLTITSEPGSTATLALPAVSLGGRAVILVSDESTTEPTPFITTDELPRLFTTGGLLQWLDQRAFAGIQGQVTAITVPSAAQTMTITRSASGWRIEAPFAAPAETSLITELLAGLQTLPFANPQAPARSTEPDSPYADTTTITLTATTRRPPPDGSLTTETTTHTLATTGPTTQSGQIPVSLQATTTAPDDPQSANAQPTLGPLHTAIDATRITELVRRPAFYIARRALSAQPTDIQSLTLTLPSGSTLHLARAGTGWTMDDAPLTEAEAAAIDALIVLLTHTPAAVTAWTEKPLSPSATPLAIIAAHGLGGLTLATVHLTVAPLPNAADDGRDYALLTTDNLARYYTPESAIDAIRWLASLDQPKEP